MENVRDVRECLNRLATARQFSVPFGALLYTKFTGYLSASMRKLEGDLSGSMSKLDQTSLI